MNPNANPVVDDSAGEELDGLNSALDRMAYQGDGMGESQPTETEETPEQAAPEEATEDQPTADAAGGATDRRSRRDGKQPASKVDLTALPEFREWQATQDRKFEAERQRRIQLEQQQAEIARQAQEAQLANLQRQFEATDSDDAEARWKLIDQIANVRTQQQMAQLTAHEAQKAQWAEYVAAQVQEAGLDPKAFPPEKYHGQPAGAFERDLSFAALKEARKLQQQASPQAIAQKAATVAAKTLREAGLDVADTTAPGKGATDDESRYNRDAQLVQMGKLSPQEFLKRWGDR